MKKNINFIYFFATILLLPFKTYAQEPDTSSLTLTTPEISTLLNSLIKAQPTSYIVRSYQRVNEKPFNQEKVFVVNQENSDTLIVLNYQSYSQHIRFNYYYSSFIKRNNVWYQKNDIARSLSIFPKKGSLPDLLNFFTTQDLK